jgi:hypothetical protein
MGKTSRTNMIQQYRTPLSNISPPVYIVYCKATKILLLKNKFTESYRKRRKITQISMSSEPTGHYVSWKMYRGLIS